MKYITKLKKILKHNNRGAGFVSVLIAVIFLASFGSMLLMVSYTGDEMRKSDRNGKKNMYDAAAVLDEIKAGLQVVCSQAVADTYEYALVYYNDPDTQAVTQIFRNKYRDCIRDYKVPSSEPTEEQRIFISLGADEDVYKYSIASLKRLAFGEDFDSESITITYSGNDSRIPVDERDEYGIATGLKAALTNSSDDEVAPIVLKNVSVTHNNGDKKTTVSADIFISFPFFDYKKESFTATDITNYACIIRGNLSQEGGSSGSVINGNAYFGSADLSTTNSLTLKGGMVVTPGTINISGQGRANPDEYRLVNEGELWADSINLNVPGATAQLDGSVYVANDLVLSEADSKAIINGNYYGFGYSSLDTPTLDEHGNRVVDSSQSSSIIVNYTSSKAHRPTLDLVSAKSLSLAGFTFIGNSSAFTNGKNSTSAHPEVQMGESASVKKVQRAYRIPARYIYCEDNDGNRVTFNTNPQVMTPDEFANINPDSWSCTFNTLWNTNKTYSDYNVTPAPRVEVSAGQSVVYVYTEFASDEDANRYFIDYYEHNKDEIDGLVESSVDILPAGSDAYMRGQTALPLTTGDLAQGVDTLAADSQVYAERYIDLQRTLSQAPSDENGDYLDPIDYFLNEINTSTLESGEIKEFEVNGKVVSLIVKGDIHINESNYPDLSFVIQTDENSTVYLERDFQGLIISSGNLNLADGVHLNEDPEQVLISYEATDTDGSNIIFYTEHIGAGGKGSTWSVYDLVGYNGWNRNSELEDE